MMRPTEMTAEDINRTYGGTYLGWKTEDTVLPLYIEGSSSNNYLSCRLYLTDGTEEEKRVHLSNPAIVYAFPDSGAYNVGDNTAMYVARQAQRQWHRGVRNSALVIKDAEGRTAHLTREMVRAMYNPTYVPFSVALHNARDKSDYSAAISRDVWLASTRRYTNPIVLYRSHIAGEIKSDGALSCDKTVSALLEEVCA